MSVATAPKDFSDLYTDLQNRVREQTGVTARENQAKRYINIGLQDMHIGNRESLPWAEREAVLRLQPPYSTGTVAITKGATALTGTGTAWNTNNDFGVANVRTTGRIVINGAPEVYRITTVGSDTSITLTDPWIDDTVTAATYEYFEDEYDLATDFGRPVDLLNFDQNGEIPLIGRNEFRRRYPRNKTTGKPKVATLVDRAPSGSTTPVRRVRFWKPADAAYLIPYAYVTRYLAVSSAGAAQEDLSADADEPIVPLAYRHAIVLHALWHWYRDQQDDDRARQAGAEYAGLIQRMVGDTEIGQSRPRIQPVTTPYRRTARRPYRGGRSRRFVAGTAFDEIRD